MTDAGEVSAEAAERAPVSELDRALRTDCLIITAEVTSPAGADAQSVRRRARPLRGHVVAVNVPDGQAVSAHLSPVAASRILLDEGLEPVLTLQCRDRNRLALQSDIIGAAALGVHNVFCLTGDAPRDPEAGPRPVFDLDSIGLLNAARGLMEGRFLSGEALRAAPTLVLGAAAHPFAASQSDRLERLIAKAAAGARFFQTQYVFDVAGFAAWLAEVRAAGLGDDTAVIATVGPLRSRHAFEFLRALAGVYIPSEIEKRFAGLSDKEFTREGVTFCAETARALAALPGVAGIHIIAPFWEQHIPELIAEAGLSLQMRRAQAGGGPS
jgi:methylenetetrahydrofolate reductase (NADPH)